MCETRMLISLDFFRKKNPLPPSVENINNEGVGGLYVLKKGEKNVDFQGINV